jgi:hypothetical protein
MSVRTALPETLQQDLAVMIAREVSGIAGIDAAITHSRADYVVMYHAIKMAKQANVEQMATLVRMQGGSPDERGGVRRTLARMEAAMTSHASATLYLRTIRRAEIELVTLYATALGDASGLAARGLRKILGRALVHAHLLTAHLAKRTGNNVDAAVLPMPLDDYFAGQDARACMRCHLDRRGASGALERDDPHPYTYICAACHDEVLGELSPDLAVQIDRWPRPVREAKIIQQALGHTSALNAIGRVLHPLAGLDPDLPTPAAERARTVPAMTPTPGPAPGERSGALVVDSREGLEGDYVTDLFSSARTWRNW